MSSYLLQWYKLVTALFSCCLLSKKYVQEWYTFNTVETFCLDVIWPKSLRKYLGMRHKKGEEGLRFIRNKP